MGVETLVATTAAALTTIGVPAATAATIAPYVLTAAAVAGSVAVSYALAPTVPGAKPVKAPKQAISIETLPRRWVIGRDLVPGTLIFRKSKSKYDLHSIGYLCEGKIDGFEEFRISGRRVATGGDTYVKTEPFRGQVQIRTKNGSNPQTVFTTTNLAFGDRWPASAKGLGMALAEWVATSPGYDDPDHSEIFAVGYPDLSAVLRGPAIFDPRLGSNPSNDNHRKWTENGLLHVVDHLLRSRLLGGWGWPVDRLDLDDIAEQAHAAEAATAKRGGGTEWRSRAGGSQNLDPTLSLADVLGSLLLSTGCDILRTRRGKVTVRLVDDAPSPTAVLPWRAILGIPSLTGGPVTFDRPNRFTLRYTEPTRDYDEVEADLDGIAWAAITDEIALTGERPSSIDLPFCPSVGQASRIGRRIAAMRRAAKTSIVANLGGLALAGHAEATVIDEGLGEALPVVISSLVTDFSSGTVAIEGVIKPALAAYDASVDQAAKPETREEVPDASAPADPTIDALAIVRTGNFGTRQWAVRAQTSFSGGAGSDQQVIYAPSADGGLTWETWAPLDRASGLLGSATASTVLQSPNHPTLTMARVAASSARSTHDVSAWVDGEVVYAPPSGVPVTPSSVLSDNGDGTHDVSIASGIHTAYFVAVEAISGAAYAQSDSTPLGGWLIEDVPDGTQLSITAYDSEDRASSPHVVSVPT